MMENMRKTKLLPRKRRMKEIEIPAPNIWGNVPVIATIKGIHKIGQEKNYFSILRKQK